MNRSIYRPPLRCSDIATQATCWLAAGFRLLPAYPPPWDHALAYVHYCSGCEFTHLAGYANGARLMSCLVYSSGGG
jgi:hypothetical protein